MQLLCLIGGAIFMFFVGQWPDQLFPKGAKELDRILFVKKYPNYKFIPLTFQATYIFWFLFVVFIFGSFMLVPRVGATQRISYVGLFFLFPFVFLVADVVTAAFEIYFKIHCQMGGKGEVKSRYMKFALAPMMGYRRIILALLIFIGAVFSLAIEHKVAG